jgi:thymidylate synthase (FAD)
MISVLDHGFVKLNNLSGPTRRLDTAFDANDVDAANVARMSFGASNRDRTYEVEMKLNRYLAQHKHMGPFEHVVVWLEMKMPIFVARQFVRHRTASINEVSGRYVELPCEFYIPESPGGKPTNNKQGQEDTLSIPAKDAFREALHAHSLECYRNYTFSLKSGVAPEHARLFLGLNHYTHWAWCQDLRNLFHMLALRDDPHAQWESQEYARAIIKLLEPHLPGLMELFEEFWRV